MRIAIGPNDINQGTVEIARRDNLSKETVKQKEVLSFIKSRLNEIQNTLFLKAKKFREENITFVDNF